MSSLIQSALRPFWAVYRSAPPWAKSAIRRTAWIPRMAVRPFASSVDMGGFTMELDLRDNGALRYLRWQGGYEKDLRDVFLDLISKSPGCFVIDVGSSYGAYALSAAAVARTHRIRRIIAVEPDERCMTAFRRSVSKNGFDDLIRSIHGLAGSYAGIGELHVSAASSTSNRSFASNDPDDLSGAAHEIVKLPAIRLDDEMRIEDRTPPFRLVVKMDVEGSEARACTGMRETLASAETVALLFEYYPTGIRAVGLTPNDVRGSLNGLNWSQILIYEGSAARSFDDESLLWDHLAQYYQGAVGSHDAINVLLLRGVGIAAAPPIPEMSCDRHDQRRSDPVQ